VQVGFGQSLMDAGLISAERSTALQQQDDTFEGRPLRRHVRLSQKDRLNSTNPSIARMSGELDASLQAAQPRWWAERGRCDRGGVWRSDPSRQLRVTQVSHAGSPKLAAGVRGSSPSILWIGQAALPARMKTRIPTADNRRCFTSPRPVMVKFLGRCEVAHIAWVNHDASFLTK